MGISQVRWDDSRSGLEGAENGRCTLIDEDLEGMKGHIFVVYELDEPQGLRFSN